MVAVASCGEGLKDCQSREHPSLLRRRNDMEN